MADSPNKLCNNSSSNGTAPTMITQVAAANRSSPHGSSRSSPEITSTEKSPTRSESPPPSSAGSSSEKSATTTTMCTLPAGPHLNPDGTKYYTVTCGFLTGKLHYDRFRCPGIHQLCVEHQGQFITPKQFTVMAAKDKQKDWKGAIKMNGHPIRTLMERREFDFVSHDEFCSGRCISKNNRLVSASYSDGGTPGATAGVGGDFSEYLYPLTLPSNPYTQFLQGYHHDLQAVIKCEDSGSDSDRPHSSTPTSSSHINAAAAVAAAAASVPQSGNPLLFPFPSLLANPFLAAANHLHRQHQHHHHAAVATVQPPPPPLPPILPQNLTAAHLDGLILDSMLVFKDPTVFWSVVHQLGLFGELMREVSLECGRLLNPNLPKMKIPEVADKLSKIVEVLGIQERLYQTLHTKRCLTKAQTAVLSTEIEELKRKTEESQKRQREMKRKSELFDQLIQPAIKQPRPHSMPSPDESTNGRDSSD